MIRLDEFSKAEIEFPFGFVTRALDDGDEAIRNANASNAADNVILHVEFIFTLAQSTKSYFSEIAPKRSLNSSANSVQVFSSSSLAAP